MVTTDFDPKTVSVEERLALIDRLWISILEDAGRGDELQRKPRYGPRARSRGDRGTGTTREELERDPSKGIPWEDFLEELRRKRG